MSKRSGGADIETNRTSQRGVYCGAWSAYVDGVPQVYESSVRVTKPSKFFVLDADGVRRLRQGRASDGGAPARRPQGRRAAAAPDHRPAREAAGARPAVGGPDPSAQQPGRGGRPRRLRPAREGRRDAAQAGDARRRQVQPRGPARAGHHSGGGGRAGRQVQGARTHRAGGLRPRGRDRRLARGPRHRAAPGTTRRPSSRPAWTPTGWSASPPRSTRSTRRRRCRARSGG